MIEVVAHPEGFGAEITGFDLNHTEDPDDVRAVVGALFEHQLIVLRGQSPTPEALERFAGCFGKPEPHLLAHFREPDHPAILRLSNICENGEPIGISDGAVFWHTDMSWQDPPGSATVVHALKTPARGGETLFADMFAAYDALDEETRAQIEDLVVLHHYGNRDDLDDASPTGASPLKADQKEKVRNVFHRLARPHPVTGRKALYGVCGSSFGITGMADDEALTLLRRLAAHATQARFVHKHAYADGEVVAWDNNSTLHHATPLDPVHSPDDPQARLLYRISVKGMPRYAA